MSFQTGVYLLRNATSRTVVDLSRGSPANGTFAQGWQQLPPDHELAYNQFWFMQPVGGNAYTLHNIKSGTVLELSNGSSANGTQAQGWARVTNSSDLAIQNQEWTFHWLRDNVYMIINRRSGTTLDLDGVSAVNGTKLQGWAADESNINQHWFVEHRTTPSGGS